MEFSGSTWDRLCAFELIIKIYKKNFHMFDIEVILEGVIGSTGKEDLEGWILSPWDSGVYHGTDSLLCIRVHPKSTGKQNLATEKRKSPGKEGSILS